jgi:uncharacterized damage-inducible protein DinB
MRLHGTFAVAVLAVSPLPLYAEAPPPAPSAFAQAIDAVVTRQSDQFLEAALAMPADRFGATPEKLKIAGSDFKGVRTFAEQVKHVAADNFAIWGPLTGEPEPAGLNAPNGPPAMTSRAEILKLLEDSVAFSHKAVASLTAENALEEVPFRGRKVTRLFLTLLATTHMGEHYGQLVVYLRAFGVVPPASRPKAAATPKPAS